MKKILFMLLLLFTTSCVYAIDIIPKVSLCLPGTFRSDYEVEVGANVGAEGRYDLSNYFALSFGFDFLINRNISMGTKASQAGWGETYHYNHSCFHMLPVFVGIVCYPFGNFGEYKPYFILNGGYNVLFSVSNEIDSKPGYYVGGGIGFELFERYIMELMVSRYEAEDNNDDVSYKNICFKFGYKFVI